MKNNNCPNYIIFLPKNVPIFLVFLSEFDVMFDDELGWWFGLFWWLGIDLWMDRCVLDNVLHLWWWLVMAIMMTNDDFWMSGAGEQQIEFFFSFFLFFIFFFQMLCTNDRNVPPSSTQPTSLYPHWTPPTTTKQQPKPVIQDDADGHLIYQSGDILHNRCSWHFSKIQKYQITKFFQSIFGFDLTVFFF